MQHGQGTEVIWWLANPAMLEPLELLPAGSNPHGLLLALLARSAHCHPFSALGVHEQKQTQR